MEEQIEFELEIPKFSNVEYNANGKSAYFKKKPTTDERFITRMLIKLYPNGNTPQNEGYVSIMFVPKRLRKHRYFSFHCTVYVEDASKELRFGQSFGMDFEYEVFPKASRNSIGLDKYIRRDVILVSREELLISDTLNLRCHVCLFLVENNESFIQRCDFLKVADVESWFVKSKTSNSITVLRLQFRNLDNALCTRLREKSNFFKCLFQIHTKEMVEGFMPIENDEYNAFFNLLCYIRFRTLKHVEDIERYCDLYMVADKYEVLELKKICSIYLKQHLCIETAAGIFAVSDLCYDPDLRKLAFEHIVLNWNEVRTTEGWTNLTEKRPDLEDEVSNSFENNEELNLKRYAIEESEIFLDFHFGRILEAFHRLHN